MVTLETTLMKLNAPSFPPLGTSERRLQADVHDEISQPVFRYRLRRNRHHVRRGEKPAARLKHQAGSPEGNFSILPS
jgi:hypothetical protein